MPKPPFPNAGRAVVGFVFGLILTAVLVGVVRALVWGLNVYIVPELTTDWFWKEQATFMFVMLGSAMGFLWGAGAVYDFEAEAATSEVKALAKPRIPLDPDAPRAINNPAVALMPASLGIVSVVAILAICIGWILAVIQLSAIPVGFTVLGLVAIGAALRVLMGEKVTFSTSSLIIITIVTLMGFGMDLNILPQIFPSEAKTQLSNPDAERTEFSEIDFNFVGLIKLENTNKGYLFAFFSLFVLFNIVGIAATLGIVLYFLNRLILSAQAEAPQPVDDSQFFPLKFVTFMTDWVLDILNGVSAMVRPR